MGLTRGAAGSEPEGARSRHEHRRRGSCRGPGQHPGPAPRGCELWEHLRRAPAFHPGVKKSHPTLLPATPERGGSFCRVLWLWRRHLALPTAVGTSSKRRVWSEAVRPDALSDLSSDLPCALVSGLIKPCAGQGRGPGRSWEPGVPLSALCTR